MRETWRQAPEGGVELIVYPDGAMGGEADMVRRMRVGQIQAALLTMTGISEIDKSVNALQDMPMMLRISSALLAIPQRSKLGNRALHKQT
jgi:TRAP-type C4-dicarboxylate transport system substrate-binding protein